MELGFNENLLFSSIFVVQAHGLQAYIKYNLCHYRFFDKNSGTKVLNSI